MFVLSLQNVPRKCKNREEVCEEKLEKVLVRQAKIEYETDHNERTQAETDRATEMGTDSRLSRKPD